MRNRIFGGIGVLWGGAVLLFRLTDDAGPVPGGAAGLGVNAGTITGALLFFVGLFYLIKGDGKSESKSEEQ